jgi:HEAT repeat protein
LAETADEPASRERTAQRLRQIGSLAPLLGALRAVDHPGLRAAAARAIGRLGQPSGLPALVEALTDPALSVRQEAAWMLGLSGRGEAIEPLSRLLASPVEPALRVTVVRALARTGQPAALAALEAASRASEPTVMAVAVAAIEQLRRRLAASESTEPIEPAEPAEPIAACRQIVLIVGAEGPAERPDYAAQLLDQLAPALLVEGVDIQVVVMAAGRPLPSLDEAAAIMRRQFMTPPAGFAWQGRQDFDQAGRPLQLWQLRALSG